MHACHVTHTQEFGIDCGEGLTWAGGTWGPGGEYIKKLVVKNIGSKIVKLKYKLPATKFFSMAFPEVIKLSPGTFHTIEVQEAVAAAAKAPPHHTQAPLTPPPCSPPLPTGSLSSHSTGAL